VHHLHGNFELGFEITYVLITPALHIVERAMPRLSNNVCKGGEARPKGAEVKPFFSIHSSSVRNSNIAWSEQREDKE
jgi:hypothetical protein